MTNNQGKIYTTKKEQILLAELREGSVVEFSQLRELNRRLRLTSEGNLAILAASLVRKNMLCRIRKGKYFVNRGKPVDPFRLGPELFQGYNAFSSALYIHGWRTEAPIFHYIACVKGSGRRRLGNFTFISVSMGKAALGDTEVGGYRVSSRAKTFFDCFLFPKYSGGVQGILRALSLSRLEGADWDEFLSYLPLAGKSDLQRMGFLLEKSGVAPRRVLAAVRRRLGRPAKVRLDPVFPARGRLDAKWNLIENIPLGD